MAERPCPSLRGGSPPARESLAVRVGGRTIHQVCALTIKEAGVFFDGLALGEREQAIARRILKEIRERLGFLQNVGLEYLTLDRAAGTLSGGEGQRIRLATQIGLEPRRRPLHPRRAVDRPPPAGQPTPPGHAPPAPRPRQHRPGRRARRGDDPGGRPRDRPRSRRRGAGRLRRRHRHPRGDHGGPEVADGALPVARALDPGPGRAPRRHRQGPDDPRGPRAQPEEHAGSHPAGDVHLRHGRVRLREMHPGQRHPLPGAGSGLPPGAGAARRARPDRGHAAPRQGHQHRPVADRPHPALQPGHVHGRLRVHPGAVRADPRRAGARLRAGALLASTSRAAGARRARATGW